MYVPLFWQDSMQHLYKMKENCKSYVIKNNIKRILKIDKKQQSANITIVFVNTTAAQAVNSVMVDLHKNLIIQITAKHNWLL